MRIGVVSDSHGNQMALKTAVEQMGDVEVIFHLGDYREDGGMIREWKKNIPVYCLKGNMDFNDPLGEDFVKTVYGGKTIIACHGHAFGVKGSLNNFFYQAKSQNADIALFGHTHFAFNEMEEDILLMNPGALSYTPGRIKSFGVITIENGIVKGEIIPLRCAE